MAAMPSRPVAALPIARRPSATARDTPGPGRRRGSSGGADGSERRENASDGLLVSTAGLRNRTGLRPGGVRRGRIAAPGRAEVFGTQQLRAYRGCRLHGLPGRATSAVPDFIRRSRLSAWRRCYDAPMAETAWRVDRLTAVATRADVPRHSAVVRVTHWLTTIGFLALLVSG